MSEQYAMQAAIEKWGKRFEGAVTNNEMMDLATKLHEAEERDYSEVAVKKGLQYGTDKRQRMNVWLSGNGIERKKTEMFMCVGILPSRRYFIKWTSRRIVLPWWRDGLR